VIWAIIAPGRGRAAGTPSGRCHSQGNYHGKPHHNRTGYLSETLQAFRTAGVQQSGTYTIRTEEQMLNTFSFIGWRQAGTIMVLHRDGGVEYAAINRQELREALVRDGDQGTNPPTTPATAGVGSRLLREQMRRGEHS